MHASPTQSAKPSLIDSSGFDGAPGPSIRFLPVLWPISVRDTLVQVKQKRAPSAIGRFVSIAVRKCTRYQEVGAKKMRKQEREKTSPAGPQQHLANQWAVGSPALGVSFGGPDADRSKPTHPGRCGGQLPCRHSRDIPIAVPFGPRFVSHSRPHLWPGHRTSLVPRTTPRSRPARATANTDVQQTKTLWIRTGRDLQPIK
jgi:hypothetical protein